MKKKKKRSGAWGLAGAPMANARGVVSHAGRRNTLGASSRSIRPCTCPADQGMTWAASTQEADGGRGWDRRASCLSKQGRGEDASPCLAQLTVPPPPPPPFRPRPPRLPRFFDINSWSSVVASFVCAHTHRRVCVRENEEVRGGEWDWGGGRF